MKKTIFKNIVCSVLFVALIIGSLSVASFVAVPKSNSKEAGMKDATARGIISEPQNTIDAVFVGDSEVYRSIMPLKIFEDYGATFVRLRLKSCFIRRNFLKRPLKSKTQSIFLLKQTAFSEILRFRS